MTVILPGEEPAREVHGECRVIVDLDPVLIVGVHIHEQDIADRHEFRNGDNCPSSHRQEGK